MKKQSRLDKPSRRQFTKTVASALLATPLAAALAEAQTKPASQRARKGSPRVTQRGPKAESNHIPPILIYSGSLSVELKHQLRRQMSSGSRPNQYMTNAPAGEQYGPVADVTVYLETEHGYVPIGPIPFSKTAQAQLKLWLQKVNTSGSGFEDLTSDSQVLIRGVSNQLVIEMDSEYHFGGNPGAPGEHTPTHKNHRPFKYKEKGQQTRDYRIGKWQVVGSSGSLAEGKLGGLDQESFTFLVSFYEP